MAGPGAYIYISKEGRKEGRKEASKEESKEGRK